VSRVLDMRFFERFDELIDVGESTNFLF